VYVIQFAQGFVDREVLVCTPRFVACGRAAFDERLLHAPAIDVDPQGLFDEVGQGLPFLQDAFGNTRNSRGKASARGRGLIA